MIRNKANLTMKQIFINFATFITLMQRANIILVKLNTFLMKSKITFLAIYSVFLYVFITLLTNTNILYTKNTFIIINAIY